MRVGLEAARCETLPIDGLFEGVRLPHDVVTCACPCARQPNGASIDPVQTVDPHVHVHVHIYIHVDQSISTHTCRPTRSRLARSRASHSSGSNTYYM